MSATVITADVPCNGCTLCCRGDMIVLHPEIGDDPSQYLTEPVIHPFTGQPAQMLRKGENGNCIYLGPGGCTIHGRAPAVCRKFDCGKMFEAMSRPERRRMLKLGLADKEVFDQGRRIAEARKAMA